MTEDMKARLRAIGWSDQKIQWHSLLHAHWNRRTWNRFIKQAEKDHAIVRALIEQAERSPALQKFLARPR